MKDTAATLNRLKPDCIIMRHPASGAHRVLSANVDALVINGGDEPTPIPP